MNRNVLLVDDVELFLEIEKKFLEGKGLLVHLARDGHQATELARSLKPAIIIMDNLMPRKNGLQACQELKASPETREIPIIMVTAEESRDIAEECFKAGADMVITKPIRRDELLSAIDSLTELRLNPASILPNEKPTVLVVEDSSFFVTLIQDTLTSRGYDVLTATGSEEACRKLEAYGRYIHLILLDLIMPKETGLQVLQKIRTLPGGQNYLVAAMTSLGPMDPMTSEVRKLGVLDFINKSIPPFDLIYRIDELLFAESSDTRRDPRYTLHVPVQFKTDKFWIMGETVNVSKNGLCIRSLELPEVGGEIVLRITFPGSNQICEEQARVVWASVAEPHRSQKLVVLDSGFGVQIEFRSPEFKDGFEALEAKYRLD